MDDKRSHPGEYIDLHRLMEAVLQLRLRVASLEKVLAGPHCELNISTSSKPNPNGRRAHGCRTRKAGLTRKAH